MIEHRPRLMFQSLIGFKINWNTVVIPSLLYYYNVSIPNRV
ncbi:hypothetical protein C789_1570 [Microcystis aeruginosa FACHB-905 = DIANCHI905]|nr:hypothetical protein C789_1570 [Microcystis aeruginosa FACHB-905 = DIANCHI905]